MPKCPLGQPRVDQRWSTFVANHAKVIVACDFMTVVMATFKYLHVFAIIELGTRKLLHLHVTDHPTAAWTQQQLREAIPSDHGYRFLIPVTGNHLRFVLKNWQTHYNQGRPHSSIGSGIPDPPADFPVTLQEHRHRIPGHLKVVSHPVLGGLHHEYELVPKAA